MATLFCRGARPILTRMAPRVTMNAGRAPTHAAAAAAVVIGGGPAGLMAAESLAEAGVQGDLFDAMPSVGCKFLLAGKGGAEPHPKRGPA